MLRYAVVGLLVRVVVSVAVACVLAALLAALRPGVTFAEGFRIAVWSIGCILLLLAAVGSSPAMRTGTLDPRFVGFFPKLWPKVAEPYSGMRVSPTALFVLSALVLFALGMLLG